MQSIAENLWVLHYPHRVLAMDFDRVILGHGDLIEMGGKGKVAEVLNEHGF